MTMNVSVSITVETKKGNSQKIEIQIKSDQFVEDLSNISALISQQIGQMALKEWEEKIREEGRSERIKSIGNARANNRP